MIFGSKRSSRAMNWTSTGCTRQPPMKIELLATSISDKPYDQIRTDVIFGRLKPGQKLRLDRLARGNMARASRRCARS